MAESYYDTIPKEQRNGKMSDYRQHLLLCAEAIHPVPVGARCAPPEAFLGRANIVNHRDQGAC